MFFMPTKHTAATIISICCAFKPYTVHLCRVKTQTIILLQPPSPLFIDCAVTEAITPPPA